MSHFRKHSSKYGAVAIVLLLLVVGGLFSRSSKGLQFSYDIEKFFPKNDKEVELYHSFRDSFENENDYIFIGLTNKKGVFDKTFLLELDSLSNWLLADQNISKVYSPTNLSYHVKAPFVGLMKAPIIHINEEDRLAKDKEKIFNSSDVFRSFFSNDTLSTRLVVKINPELSKIEGTELIASIKSKAQAFNFDEAHFAGRLHTQDYYLKTMRSEMSFFILLASLIIIISLILVIGNLRIVSLILFSIVLSTIYTFGLIGVLGLKIDLMIVMLPAIIIITGTSSSIHLYSDLTLKLKSHVPPLNAVKASLKETGLPIFLNTLTTAAGFAALAFVPVQPLQIFGLIAAAGILITYAVSVCITIASALLIGTSLGGIKPLLKWKKVSFKGPKISNRAGIAMIVFIFVVGFLSLQNLKSNNYFLEDLKDGSSLKNDLLYFENNYDGIRPFELLVKRKNNETLNRTEITELQSLEGKLKTIYGSSYVQSPLNMIRSVNQTLHSGDQKHSVIPADEATLNQTLAYIEKNNLWNKAAPILNGKEIRVSMRVKDLGSTKLFALNEKLYEFTDKLTSLGVKPTGAAYLMDHANSEISSYLIQGILLAIVISTLSIYMISKSLWLTLISLIPNAIPLLFASIFMWLFGISLNIGTSMVFTIIFGLAVDDTMHFIHKFKKHQPLLGTDSAIAKSITELRKPMFNTTIVLSLGFLMFGFSQFNSISTIGSIVGLSLVVALFADFYLLPILLSKYPSKEETPLEEEFEIETKKESEALMHAESHF